MTVDTSDLLGRGISFPPRIGPDGRLAFSDGVENVRESIRVILSTDRSERVMLPQFGGGLRRYLFEPNTASTHRLLQQRILEALGRWEPRIEVESVTVTASPSDPREAEASIRYRLRATDADDRVDLTLRVAG